MTTTRCWCGGETQFRNDVLHCRESGYHDPKATGRPMVVRRLYVSGPMSGRAKCNYPQFNVVAETLAGAGFEVVNPADFGSTGRHYTDLLREDLRMLLDCDGVATLDEWWESPGSRTEASVAGILRMPVRPWEEWAYGEGGGSM